jgi:Ca2+-binding RTX toxin-like protein
MVVALTSASGVARAATVNGDDGNNTLVGTQRPETILGLVGDDTMKGLGRHDKMYGGDGVNAQLTNASYRPGIGKNREGRS